MEPLRRILIGLLVATFVVALAFLVVIAAGIDDGVGVHEIAGLLLFVLLIGSAVLAARGIENGRRPLIRILLALVALVVAGALGGALAMGFLPSDLGGAPLVPLILLLVAVADGARAAGEVPVPPPIA